MRIKLRKRRAAISEILGSLIMIAITLVAGAAVFGFVNGQAGSSSAAVGNSAANNINFLNEREVIVYASVVSLTPSASANVWVYNSGLINPLTIAEVLVFQGSTQLCPSATWTMPPVAQYSEAEFSTTDCLVSGIGAFNSTNAYTFEVVGQYGSSAQITVTF